LIRKPENVISVEDPVGKPGAPIISGGGDAVPQAPSEPTMMMRLLTKLRTPGTTISHAVFRTHVDELLEGPTTASSKYP
jgi:hypothetical protein